MRLRLKYIARRGLLDLIIETNRYCESHKNVIDVQIFQRLNDSYMGIGVQDFCAVIKEREVRDNE